MPTEASARASIHRQLPANLHRWGISARFAAGVPDTWYSGPKGDLWIEYKIVDTIGCTPKLTQLQLNWLTSRHNEGRNVAVATYIKATKTWYLLRDNNWHTPHARPKTLLKPKDLADWICEQTLNF